MLRYNDIVAGAGAITDHNTQIATTKKDKAKIFIAVASAASCRVAATCLTIWTYDGDLFRGHKKEIEAKEMFLVGSAITSWFSHMLRSLLCIRDPRDML